MKQMKEKAKLIKKAEDIRAKNNVHKERYLKALQHSKGDLDEEQLGQSMGFSKEYSCKIVEELTAEGKVGAKPKRHRL